MELVTCVAFAAFGGIIRLLLTGKGLVLLPRLEKKNEHRFLNIRFLAPIIIGILVGITAPELVGRGVTMAFIGGYLGSDVIGNFVESVIGRRK